jgi:hypothetical protein
MNMVVSETARRGEVCIYPSAKKTGRVSTEAEEIVDLALIFNM